MMDNTPIPTRYLIGVSVGEVYVDSKEWGKIPLEEFKKRGGVIRFATNNKVSNEQKHK